MPKNAAAVQPDLLGQTPAPKTAATKTRAKQSTPLPPPPKTGSAVVVQAPAPKNMLAIIAQAASDPRCVPENMRALLDMQKEIMAEEARIAFTESFIALQQDLPVIDAKGKIEIKAKDAKGERTGRVLQSTPYATFNEINRVTRPILQKHGFALSFATDQGAEGRLIVKGFLKHIRGHQETTTFALPLETSGSKNNVQGVGSSMSYGKRYATVALLNIVSAAPEDADTDGVPGAKIVKGDVVDADVVDETPLVTSKQRDELIEAIEACGVGRAKFLQHYQIDKVDALPASLFAQAMGDCKDYAKKHGAKRG